MLVKSRSMGADVRETAPESVSRAAFIRLVERSNADLMSKPSMFLAT